MKSLRIATESPISVDENGNYKNAMHSDLLPTTSDPQDNIVELKNSLDKATLEVDKLKAQKTHQKRNQHHNEQIDVRDQNDSLMNILMRKDSAIKTMSAQLNSLEEKLQSAVSGKLNALDRLEGIEAKELTISFKEKRMDLEAKNLNQKIENLTDDLSRNVTELIAVREELASASAQFDVDINAKSEQLRVANLNICELSQTNHELTVQNEEYVLKLKEQLNESRKLMDDYENELNAKTDLAKLHKENTDHTQEYIDGLTSGVTGMRQLLNESVDDCGTLETKLKGIEIDRQMRTAAVDEVISKLKQELKDANCLLKEYIRDDDNYPEMDSENDQQPLTLTEIYTRYCDAVTELQNKEQEYQILQLEMENLVKDVKDRAIRFNEQQAEIKNHQAANEKLIEERNYFRAEKVVCREELERYRSKCELLKIENGELKFYGSQYLKELLPKLSSQLASVKLEFPEIDGNSHSQSEAENGRLVNASELIGRIGDFKRVDVVEGTTSTGPCEENFVKIEESSQDSRKRCSQLLAPSSEESFMKIEELSQDNHSTLRTLGLAPSREENFMKIEELSQDNRTLRSQLLAMSREENFMKIAELSQANIKLLSEVWELNAEKNVLAAQVNSLNDRNSCRQHQIETLEQRNQHYLGTIEEQKMAYNCLGDVNRNVQSEHRELLDMKKSLVIEVESLKQELIQEKARNKCLRKDLELFKASVASSNVFKLVPMDTVIENDAPMGDHSVPFAPHSEPIQVEKNMFFESLQLTESQPQKATDKIPQTTTSTNVNSRKRSNQELNASELTSPSCPNIYSPPNEKSLVTFIRHDSDGRDAATNLELQCLSEVRTRKQARFIHTAFHVQEEMSSGNVEPMAENNNEVPNPARGRISRRGRSSNWRGRSQNVQTSSRSQSAGQLQPSVSTVHQRSVNGRNQNADNVTSCRRSSRLVKRSCRLLD